jgi:hypothetical protein
LESFDVLEMHLSILYISDLVGKFGTGGSSGSLRSHAALQSQGGFVPGKICSRKNLDSLKRKQTKNITNVIKIPRNEINE